MILCPCCGFRTLRENGGLQVCPVCYWEDDGRHIIDDKTYRGGPGNILTLYEARITFAELECSDLLWIGLVRPPLESER
jgi:hypothetical protein